MTTQTDRAQPKAPRGISRIDPALRDAAASLDIVEFRAESLPAERERADRLAAERAAAVDTGRGGIEDRGISGPGDERLGLRLYRGQTKSAAPLVLYAHGGGFVTGNLDTDHPHCVDLARAAGCVVGAGDTRGIWQGRLQWVISCAEIDPCRDEPIDYANRLLHAYVHTELHVVAATFHGFDSVVAEWVVSRESAAPHAQVLRRAFAI